MPKNARKIAKPVKSKKDPIRLAASKANQWYYCPGFLTLEKNNNIFESRENAIKGTLVHKLAEDFFSHFGYKDDISKDIILNIPAFKIEELLTYEKEKEDILKYIHFYHQRINLDIETMQDEEGFISSEILIEDRRQFNGPDFILTAISDATIIFRFKSKIIIHIYDLKTGYVEVGAQNNLQLFLSGLLVAKDILGKSKLPIEIKGTIIQPSLNIISSETFPFIPEILETLWQPKDAKIFEVGPHCLYCDYKDVCPTFQKAVKKYLNPKFQDQSFDRREKWTELLDIAGPMIKLFEQVKSNAYQAAQLGVDIPKYSLTDKPGRRTWNGELTPRAIAKKLGFEEDDVSELKLSSPKTIDDKLKGDEKRKVIFEQLIYTPTIRYLKRENEGLKKRGKK